MADDFDLPLERDELTRPIREAPDREPPSKPPWIGIAAAVAAIALAIAWLALRSPRTEPDVGAAPPAPAAAAASEPAASTPVAPLPALGASDALVRELAARLSALPRLAVWLAGDALVRRYVLAVQNVAEGASPARLLRPLRPQGAFATLGDGDERPVDPASFRRYDGVAEVFASLDAAGVADLHRRLAPLLEEAYREAGDPTVDFRHQLERAIRRLLDVPVPRTPVRVVAEGRHWRWADPGLDARSDAEKHLLRMGPANQRRVQEKLAELAAALDRNADRGPDPARP